MKAVFAVLAVFAFVGALGFGFEALKTGFKLAPARRAFELVTEQCDTSTVQVYVEVHEPTKRFALSCQEIVK